MIDKTKFYINGEWVKPLKENNFNVINPSTEESYAQISLGSKEDLDLAVQAAKNALYLPGESNNVFSMPSFVDFTASDVGTDLEFNILGEPTTTKTITINTNERTITIVAPTGYIYAHN